MPNLVLPRPSVNAVPPRTLEIFEKLWAMQECGIIRKSMVELAESIPMHRNAFSKHFQRLRNIGMIKVLHTSCDYATKWFRVLKLTRYETLFPVAEKLNSTAIFDLIFDNYTPLQSDKLAHGSSVQETPYLPENDVSRGGANFLKLSKKVLKRDRVILFPAGGATPPERVSDFLGARENERAPHTSGRLRTVTKKEFVESPVSSHAADLGEALDACFNMKGPHRKARVFDQDQIPAYPSSKVCRPAVLPRMFRLTECHDSNAKLLIKSYKRIVRHKYKKNVRVDKKAFFRMRVAVDAMKKHGIKTPCAWAFFRIMSWKKFDETGKPPAIDYIFSAKTIEKHSKYFKQRESSFNPIRMLRITKSHSALLDLWQKINSEVRSENYPPGRIETERIVNSILPPTKYAQLLKQAEEERLNLEFFAGQRHSEGEWIWA